VLSCSPAIDEPVFVHPESVLSRDPLPAYVIYQELMEGVKKIYMKGDLTLRSCFCRIALLELEIDIFATKTRNLTL